MFFKIIEKKEKQNVLSRNLKTKGLHDNQVMKINFICF